MKFKGLAIIWMYLVGFVMGLLVWHLAAKLIGAVDLIGMLIEAL